MSEQAKPTRRATFAEMASGMWQATFPVNEHGHFSGVDDAKLIVGTLVNIRELVRTIPKAVRQDAILDEMKALRSLLAPDAPPDPAKEKAAREKASRERAWAAYKKAGGVMAMGGDVADGPPEMADPGCEPGAWTAALEAHKKAVQLWHKTNAPTGGDCSAPVADLLPSVRARKCLNRLGVGTIGELTTYSADELLGCRNFGQTSLDEIREKLKAIGLALRGESP